MTFGDKMRRAAGLVSGWLYGMHLQDEALKSYDRKGPPRNLAVNRFSEGDVIPLRGYQWQVAKIVDGALPVLMLSPLAPTKKEHRSLVARLRNRRNELRANEERTKRAIEAQLRKDRPAWR